MMISPDIDPTDDPHDTDAEDQFDAFGIPFADYPEHEVLPTDCPCCDGAYNGLDH